MPRSIVAPVVAAPALSGAASANLVTNGDFNTGDFTGWNVAQAVVGSNITVDIGGAGNTSAAYFRATGPGYDAISQLLPTSAGAQYLVEFWILNYGVGDDSLVVMWEGGIEIESTPVASELESLVYWSFQVTATGDGSTLAFLGYDGISAFLLEDVSVTLIPAPSAAGLLALAGTGALRRRR